MKDHQFDLKTSSENKNEEGCSLWITEETVEAIQRINGILEQAILEDLQLSLEEIFLK